MLIFAAILVYIWFGLGILHATKKWPEWLTDDWFGAGCVFLFWPIPLSYHSGNGLRDCVRLVKQFVGEFVSAGWVVGEVVLFLTNPPKQPGQNRAARKAEMRQRIAAAGIEVRTIKMLDRIDNLAEMAGGDKEFAALYVKESRLLADAIFSPELASLRAEMEEKCQWLESA